MEKIGSATPKVTTRVTTRVTVRVTARATARVTARACKVLSPENLFESRSSYSWNLVVNLQPRSSFLFFFTKLFGNKPLCPFEDGSEVT